jgi:hypothetical protein
MHCRQTTRSRAAEQPQQNGLGLIVPRMAKRDDVSGKMSTRAAEKLVTRTASRMLNRMSFARGARRNILAPDKALPSECRSRGLAELFVAIGRLAQLMIEMSHTCDGQFAHFFERMQQVRERDRIAAA